MEKKEIKELIKASEFIRIADDVEKLFEEFEQKAHDCIIQAQKRLKGQGINDDLLEEYKLEIFHLLTEGNSVIAYYKEFRKSAENEINKRLEIKD